MGHLPTTAIVASTPEGTIGDGQAMPWRLAADLRRFKRLTMGGTLLMGRRTFDSIGRALPGRQTIVLTRQLDWTFPGVDVAASEDDVWGQTRGRELFVVGGGQVYAQWWGRCETLWLTRVWATIPGDTRVELPLNEFVCQTQMACPATPEDQYPTEWSRWARKKTSGK